jgi:type II secretory pathway component GspD/PulD (secretin)
MTERDENHALSFDIRIIYRDHFLSFIRAVSTAGDVEPRRKRVLWNVKPTQEESRMRKLAMGITALLYMATQSGLAEVVIGAQDHAVDSDVVLESAVREIKSAPRDAVNVVGDSIKFVADETVTAAKGVAAAFKSNPIDKVKKEAALQTATAWDSSNDIIFRSYKLSEEVGKELLGASGGNGDVVDVSSAFSGIDFPQGASAYLRPEFNRVFVRNTLSNVLSIEDILAELHSAERDMLGKQVSIETKFIEVNQTTLNELGFEWTLNSSANLNDNLGLAATDLFVQGLRSGVDAIGAAAATDSMILSKTTGALRWDVVINALEQSSDTDVLSAPSILTRDGSTANIMVGESRTIATAFDVKNSESSLYVEYDLEVADLGVMLEVTPELRSDSLIDLDLKPKVIELIAYDEYYPLPENVALISPNSLLLGDTPLLGRMPVYRLREMETQVTVADGSTVGMGGLIYDKLETFRDKVPVLGSIPYIGRLFRSEGENNIKRNLMIFVTATQVDVNGRKTSDLALKN